MEGGDVAGARSERDVLGRPSSSSSERDANPAEGADEVALGARAGWSCTPGLDADGFVNGDAVEGGSAGGVPG